MKSTHRPLLLLCLFGAAPISVADEAHDLLRKMQQSLRTLNYQADLVYLQQDQLESMRLTHISDEGREREQLIALNGPPREVLRDDNSVYCVEPKKRSVSVGRRHGGQELSPFRNFQPDQMAPFYRFEVNGIERIAGRDATRVMIRPLDSYRYGQRLWLDGETGLPLKADRLDGDGKPVSQVMFTRLKVDSELQLPPLDEQREKHGGYSWTIEDSENLQDETEGTPTPWTFAKPPPGFKLIAHAKRTAKKGADPVEHFVFGDGIATLSVYIEGEVGVEPMVGASKLGAVNVFSAQVNKHQVTVVGEVPEQTVREMASTVRRSTAAN